MTPETFRALVSELALENPLAVRPLLRLLEIRFTESVETLAVSGDDPPALLVNLSFVGAHCANDTHVKALILHEFLHVLLQHTSTKAPSTEALHLAMDAVINAVIHRQAGPEYSSMMSRYYAKAHGVQRLLRPITDAEWNTTDARDWPFVQVWNSLYRGDFVVDDIRELVEDLAERDGRAGERPAEGRTRPALLGNHAGVEPLDEALKDALDLSLRSMTGDGPFMRAMGYGGAEVETRVASSSDGIAAWRRKALEVLRRHVLPDPRGRADDRREMVSLLPVISPADRRAFLRSMWSPFLPESSWGATVPDRRGSAQVYLDVSGSMSAEMPHLVALLSALRRWIRMPFWAFSTRVAPARIENGVLRSRTTGGTSIECVLRHVAGTRPERAVIVTDGYIEAVDPALVKAIGTTRLHALVTRDGSTKLLDAARIPCTQLDRLPGR